MVLLTQQHGIKTTYYRLLKNLYHKKIKPLPIMAKVAGSGAGTGSLAVTFPTLPLLFEPPPSEKRNGKAE